MYIYLITLLLSFNSNPQTPFQVEPNFMHAIAYVESTFDNCAQRGQYNGRFQQGTAFSIDLGYLNSFHVLCNRQAAEKDFIAYQRKYHYLTKGNELRMMILHARGPGTVKRGKKIPWNYLWRYVDARFRIRQRTLIVK